MLIIERDNALEKESKSEYRGQRQSKPETREDIMAKWSHPEYSRKNVNKAGKALIDEKVNADDYENALLIVNNWRASHAYPMNTFQATLRYRAELFDHTATIAQRIKRLESIEAKLRREKYMALSQMQDVGGCRAIVQNMRAVNGLALQYLAGGLSHEMIKCYDYIENPASSGYRGIHLVFRYMTQRSEAADFNNLRLEIQIRSRLQHLWATAVETVGIFTTQALKASIGDAVWLRFFALTGSAVAMIEDAPLIPGLPSDRAELKDEILRLVDSYQIFTKFDAFAFASDQIQQLGYDGPTFLLRIDIHNRLLRIESFTDDQHKEAAARYLEIEKEAKQESGIDAVLVSVESFRTLRKAYPNYFADTKDFTREIQNFLSV